MKIELIKFILIISVLILVACNENKTASYEKIKPSKIKAEKIDQIDEDNDFADLAVYGGNLILIDRSQEEIFQVYSTNGFRKIGSFGIIGEGPENFSLPKFVKSSFSGNISDDFWIFDPNKKLLKNINLKTTDGLEYSFTESRLIDPKVLGSFDINILKNGKMIGKNPIDGKGNFYLFDPSNKEISWIDFHPEIPEKNIANKNKAFIYNSVLIYNEKNNKIVQAMYFFNQIHLYDQNTEILKSITIGDLNIPDFSEKSHSLIPPSLVYNFVDLKTTDNYIFALFQGIEHEVKMSKPNKEFYSKVYKFDWDGNIIEIYELELLLNLIALDSKNDKIYGLHFNREENSLNALPEIYQYKLKID
ncbi:TolB-like protein [Algoriphagus ratkowskyi]|uniref:TolB-like protein n=1 Tax=Algoriphagus ratkowskyi TaxID=57028 RepID=A0A2W7SF44_9BACT|nr:BF3164 family lipoprotein [Algoriphagus ratkowskyi]PZX49322.1 TolB-like protein [Algoriphagus ratkowskyi]TXD75387.1 hypothetical protein ESW18_20700 [Algoriphagus ratkowskyi]